jgi:PBP1b-binding outer membrane lipoprotein LpoB
MMNRRVLVFSSFALIACGCSTSPKYPAIPASSVPWVSGPITPSKRQDVVIHAMAMLDRGYTYGGKKLHTGFDCSGLVSFV